MTAHLSAAEHAAITALMRNGIKTDARSGLQFYTGYSYDTLYDWDQYFEAIMQLAMGWPTTYIENGVRLFLLQTDARGFSPRSRAKDEHRLAEEAEEMAKPFLAQIVLLTMRHTGSSAWLTDAEFSRLQAFVQYWLHDLSKDGGQLSYWRSGPHTGMDTQHERAGYWRDDISAGVDLNCYLYRECLALALVAEARGALDVAARFRTEAATKKDAILTRMWDDADGFFYDRDTRTGAQLKIKSAAGFMPLWAGIATPAQAQRLVREHLLNPAEFWRAFPLPAYAASEPGYREHPVAGADVGCLWRAHTWIPVNYVVMHALRQYGFTDLARDLAQRTITHVRTIGVYEYYTADSCTGCGLHPFWGWSLLAYLMPGELARSLDPTALTLHALHPDGCPHTPVR